ncbi:DNA repair ATPase [Saccharomonospora piscinae]|uniref:DNA repair ATPase n=1 Tax=Saccharomonospora piscinae TaxID=687388 RepID=A0A1V9A4N2_SACPI|nr:DNA repair ATPase [Saccharomonospora piscinae]
MPHPSGGTHAPAVPVAESHPSRWGRVDDDGTVYVRTADGERKVGVWQAGSADEGLMHYARRFDDLRTEVELLQSRLASGAGDPKQALSTATHLRDTLPEAAVVGDLDALRTRLDHVVAHAESALERGKQERERARAAAVARKQELAAEAEEIATSSTQWKAAGDRLKAILDEWKTVKGVDRKTDDELWKRFSKARESFSRRRGSHFAELDKQRAAAKQRKEELIEEAESLSDSTDWGPTAGRYKDLMAEWKAAGRAPKDADDALWQRFRAAQDTFFSRRSAAFSERDAEFAENAARKEELLTEAEKIDPSANLDAAKSQLRRIQASWDEIGKVPRERMRELDGRLKAVQDRVRSAEDARWRRTDPEAEARAAQFRERVEQFESQAEKARAAGDDRRAKKAEEQAAQWREWLRTAEEAVANR